MIAFAYNSSQVKHLEIPDLSSQGDRDSRLKTWWGLYQGFDIPQKQFGNTKSCESAQPNQPGLIWTILTERNCPKETITTEVVVWKRLRILCVCHLIMCPIIVITLTWYQDVLHSFLSPPMKAPSPPPTAISLAEEWFPAPAKSVMQPSGTRLVCQFFGLPWLWGQVHRTVLPVWPNWDMN